MNNSMNNLKMRQQVGGVLLAGCLFVSVAQAQDAPAIQSVDQTPVANPGAQTAPITETAPVPKGVARPLAARMATLEMSFRDISVKELLNIVGPQFGINIVVNGEVDGMISSINLTNQTPEEALQAIVAGAGNLAVTRLTNGTYIVKKAQPGEATGMASAAPSAELNVGFNPTPREFGKPITPTPSTFSPGVSTSFGPSTFDVPGGAGVLPALGQHPALAPMPELTPISSPNGRAPRTFRLKNIKPSLMAYWLDPAHNPLPDALQMSNQNARAFGNNSLVSEATEPQSFQSLDGGFAGGATGIRSSPYVNPYARNVTSSQMRPTTRSNSQFGRGGGGTGGIGGRGGAGGGGGAAGAGTFELPGSIEQLVSVDPQNVLLVAGGTDEDIRRLQELIDVLDQPLRQVEISTQFIDLSTDEARAFGIDFSTSRGNIDAATTGLASAPVTGAFQIGFARGNFQARLNALIADRRAKVITAPRVTAINNLTAVLQSRQSRPLILTSVSQNIGGQQAQQQRLLFISTTIGLAVTPTINGDDTITVALRPEVTTQGGDTGLGNINQRSLETIANVRDGDTIVLGGLKSLTNSQQNYKVPLLGDLPFIGGLFRSKTISETETELIIFLTARILRRAGEDAIVAGT